MYSTPSLSPIPSNILNQSCTCTYLSLSSSARNLASKYNACKCIDRANCEFSEFQKDKTQCTSSIILLPIQSTPIIKPVQLSSATPESVKALISVTDKGQTHRRLLGPTRFRLGTQLSRVVRLRNLVNGKVLCVDGRLQLGFEWCADAAELIPLDAAEEGMVFDLLCTKRSTKTMFGVADETVV